MTDNTPAFPISNLEDGYAASGMTLRDYFAGQAINATLQQEAKKGDTAESIALHMYSIADAMMEARKQ